MSGFDQDLDGGMLAVFIPRPGTDLADRIARGSGIVGTQLFDARDVLIDYEGNLNAAENIRCYADRVHQAASRHTEHYPTIARMAAHRADLIEVGEFDGDAVYIYPDCFRDLAWWLGLADKATFDPHELHRSATGQGKDR